MTLTQAQKDAARQRLAKTGSALKSSIVVNASPDVAPDSPAAPIAPSLEQELSREAFMLERDSALFNANSQDDASVDDIPWADDIPIERALSAPIGMTLVEGFTITPDMSEEQAEALSETVHSYIGVIPKAIDNYCGRWLTIIGCVLMPIRHDVIDETTGEVLKTLEWTAPLFKTTGLDDVTGQNIVLTGGGKYGKQFAQEMTAIYGPGDWKRPKEVFISQESRGKGDGMPAHRMYRFSWRRPKVEK